jgi:hypothetical protein
MNAFRVLLLLAAVHLAALAFGAWVVMGAEAASLLLLWAGMLAWPALFLRLVAPSGDWAPLQSILRPLFALVYRRWLWDEWSQTHFRVERVTGWRSARIADHRGGRRRNMAACFWGLT